MKKIAFYCSLLYFFVALSGCNQNNTPKTKGKWELVWEEKFNNGYDDTVWSKIPRGSSDWDNYMSNHEACFGKEDGHLILRGIKNLNLSNDTARYLTGGIYTKGKKTFGFGRLEVKVKMNSVKGAWPAIWMLPENVEWPKGGEIDIMERLSYDQFVYQTIHSEYTERMGHKDNPVSSVIASINTNGPNIFAVEKYPDSLVFFVNNTRTKKYPKVPNEVEEQFPFDKHDFYLLIDMQLGGNWVGGIKDSDLPAEMWVDWVRFYELKGNEAR